MAVQTCLASQLAGFVNQPGLADAGVAGDEDDTAPSLAGFGEVGLQHGRRLVALEAEGIPGWSGSCPEIYRERAFVDALREAGIPTTVRDTRGRDIDGACGQLAAADAS